MVKFIITGMVIGGLVGWIMNFSLILGIILGAIFGGIIYAVIAKRNAKQTDETTESHEERMLLREEQLDITKERVQTGEVKIHKEVVEDKKTITVPIRREELVVEAGDEEAYRIPLKVEEVQIIKNPVKVNEVSVSKRQVEEIEQVKEIVKKETADVEIKGNVDVKKEGD